MAKLNAKECAAYAAAEEHLRAKLCADMSCCWELTHPANAGRVAMLAGFLGVIAGQPRLMILQVYKNGEGWEIYGAPSSNEIGETCAALRRMWAGAP